MDKTDDPNRPSEDTAASVLRRISPGSTLGSIDPLAGSYSNYTHLDSASHPDGSTGRYVIRRYKIFGEYDRGEKAVREFRTLEHMAKAGVPVPLPLLLDETGALLGSPGIITGFVPGGQIDVPEEPESSARTLGAVLGRIHSVHVDAATRKILLDANAEVTWFIRNETVPECMAAHPEGPRVWEVVRTWYPKKKPVAPGPVHVDYWADVQPRRLGLRLARKGALRTVYR